MTIQEQDYTYSCYTMYLSAQLAALARQERTIWNRWGLRSNSWVYTIRRAVLQLRRIELCFKHLRKNQRGNRQKATFALS